MKLYDDVLKIVDTELNKTVIDIALLKKTLAKHSITVTYDEKLTKEVLSKYYADSVEEPPIIPISIQRGEELFYMKSTAWMDTHQYCYYGVALYYDIFELHESNHMDMIFHLYIANSGDFSDGALDNFMEIPNVKARIGHIPYEIIRMAAEEEAERANKLIGLKIY